ncbi:MAG: glycosyltransferase family 9 protein [Flavobacteriales bacterium]|nr:glycosyltransferase family 9 protein [Flavobacteriales bacterium]
MNVNIIKWVDRRVGVIICRVLSSWNALLPDPRSKTVSKKILFIKMIEQGASVLAYSALTEAISKVGKENVYFLVFEENKFILDFLDILEDKNIIIVRNSNFTTFLRDIYKALRFIRKEKIDSSVDMEFFSRASAIISYLSGAKKRVGLYSFTSEHPYRGNLITHKIHYNPYVHVSKYYLLLVRALEDAPMNEPLLKIPLEQVKVENPSIRISSEVVDRLKVKFENRVQGKRIVVLNPNASDMLPLRKWETSNFESLAKRISDHYNDVLLVFTGVEKERIAIEKLTSKIPESSYINLAGKTTLDELMALYQIADVLVTNDSGPAHFASMFNVQIIVLFGPETPKLFTPLGNNVHVIYKNLACSPCVSVFNHRFSPCSDNICMKMITVDEVLDKVKSLL